ncbi:MAG: PIG-L family deacetylase [Candidatus Omnitrophica bacterium]|nr:PIG-L family deacetylase [Candidatus Omnitrophota bacterium]
MNILAIGAHPDDIEFGCGGTLLKYTKAKNNVYLLILTKGEIGASGARRCQEQKESAKFLKAKRVFWGNYKDTKICLTKELIGKIEAILNKVKPEIVLFNAPSDIHQDHRVVAEAAISATRYIKKVLFYEVPTTIGFEPDIFVDIGDIIFEKLQLLKLHRSQVHKTRVPGLSIMDSATSCANFRGFQGRVKYAEGFKALRFMLES